MHAMLLAFAACPHLNQVARTKELCMTRWNDAYIMLTLPDDTSDLDSWTPAMGGTVHKVYLWQFALVDWSVWHKVGIYVLHPVLIQGILCCLLAVWTCPNAYYYCHAM
jgi:hypothetical protein